VGLSGGGLVFVRESAENKSSAASPASTRPPHDNPSRYDKPHVTAPIEYSSPTPSPAPAARAAPAAAPSACPQRLRQLGLKLLVKQFMTVLA
jgi:hypothetical protein